MSFDEFGMHQKLYDEAAAKPASAHASALSGSWRDTLFVWQGTLSAPDKSRRLTWEGAWVAVPADERDVPTSTTLRASENKFKVHATISEGAWARIAGRAGAQKLLEVAPEQSKPKRRRSAPSRAQTTKDRLKLIEAAKAQKKRRR